MSKATGVQTAKRIQIKVRRKVDKYNGKQSILKMTIEKRKREREREREREVDRVR